MLKMNNGQLDMFDIMIFESLVPKDHLLVKVDSVVDFSFVYERVKDLYSNTGRGSKDPIMMVKILLLEYLYDLSDPGVVARIGTDIVFRWFLGLGVKDKAPDDSTISHFRTQRLSEAQYDEFFGDIVRQCIKKDLIKTKRYIIDSTNVDADVNYPSEKKLIRAAYKRLIDEVAKFNDILAKEQLENFEREIQQQYDNKDKVRSRVHFEIAQKHLGYLYLKTYDELQTNPHYEESFGICYDLVDQYLKNKKDKIVSVVDPDAKVAHKSPGNVKRGYKDHIIVDEDSEIIIGSVQTPFNVGDEKKLEELVDQVESNFGIKPKEISADKVYGTIDNRAFLQDNEIVSIIQFYKESSRESEYFKLKDFTISADLSSVTCPNCVTTIEYKNVTDKNDKEFKQFTFSRKDCDICPLRNQCLYKNKNGRVTRKSRKLDVPLRYGVILSDMERSKTEAFKEAYNKRYKIERRFATMVRNHGLRRCRYRRNKGAKIHITLANMACNIIRMVNLIFRPINAMPSY